MKQRKDETSKFLLPQTPSDLSNVSLSTKDKESQMTLISSSLASENINLLEKFEYSKFVSITS